VPSSYTYAVLSSLNRCSGVPSVKFLVATKAQSGAAPSNGTTTQFPWVATLLFFASCPIHPALLCFVEAQIVILVDAFRPESRYSSALIGGRSNRSTFSSDRPTSSASLSTRMSPTGYKERISADRMHRRFVTSIQFSSNSQPSAQEASYNSGDCKCWRMEHQFCAVCGKTSAWPTTIRHSPTSRGFLICNAYYPATFFILRRVILSSIYCNSVPSDCTE
jgi:hypothetical protein